MNRFSKITTVIFLFLILTGIFPLRAQWVEDGVPICTAPGVQTTEFIVSDGVGGGIIAWFDRRNNNIGIYAQRINASGAVQWTADGVVICADEAGWYGPRMISDGAGGAIIIWQDYRTGSNPDIRAQRIDANGINQWEEGGVAICITFHDQINPQVTSTGEDGAIITWEDYRNGPDNADIYAQSVDAGGNVRWTTDGIPICTVSENQNRPQLTSTGAGCAIITWEDFRTTGGPDVYAQKIDAGGTPQWSADGNVICTVAPDYAEKVRITADGSDGAIIAWMYYQSMIYSYNYIFAQRIDANGTAQWASNGLAVCITPGNQRDPQVISDNAGGAIIAWRDLRSTSSGIYAQKINAGGTVQWMADGAPICTSAGGQNNLQLISDGAGGAFIVWQDFRSGNYDVYAQAIDSNGNERWTADGVSVCATTEDQINPQLTFTGAGGAIITWEDYRSGIDSDIYTQKTGLWGGIVTPWISFPATTAGDTSEHPLIIFNRFNQPLMLRESSEREGPFVFSQSFKDSLLNGITIEPDSFISATVYFSPMEGGSCSKRVYFEEVGTGDTVAVVHFQGEGRALYFDWTTAGLYPDRLLGIDGNLIIEETMKDSVEIDSLILFYAQGGAISYERKRLELSHDDPVNDRYLGVLPALLGGSRGLNFYVAAYNGSAVSFNPSYKSPERFRISIDNLSLDEPHPAAAYKMFSFPISIPSNTIVGILDDDLGGRDITRWRMYTYIPSEANYLELPSDSIYAIEHGKSYWLISKEAATLDTAPEVAVSTPTDSAFLIILEPGWNMIGNPFNFSVSWDSVRVESLAVSEQDVVESPVWWNSSRKGYDLNIDHLKPFEGYWVKNLSEYNVALRVPSVESPSGLPFDVPPAFARQSETSCDIGFRVRIKAASCRTADLDNYIGIETNTENYWDKNDRSEPPMSPAPSISLYFPHPCWKQHPGNYSSDVRREYQALKSESVKSERLSKELWGHIWYFDVAKNFLIESAGDEVLLEFEGLEIFHGDVSIYLIDRYLNELIDIRENNSYSFFLGKKDLVSAEEDARFMLLLGSVEFIDKHREEIPKTPPQTILHQNFPNPFNPSTIIRYEIAKAGEIAISIYDIMGSQVKVLYRGFRKPGVYEIGWNGENEKGIRVASGVYISCLSTAGDMQTKKMILLE